MVVTETHEDLAAFTWNRVLGSQCSAANGLAL